MKVIYFFDEDDKYGAAKAGLELIIESKENGVYPIVCTSKKNNINEICNELKIENYYLGYHKYTYTYSSSILKNSIKWIPRFFRYKFGNMFAAIKIKKCINMNEISLIHANNSGLDFGIMISKIYNIPNIVHIREFGVGEKNFSVHSYRMKYIEYLNKSVTRFIAISNTVKDFWISKGLDKEKIDVVYDGMDLTNIQRKKYKENDCKKKLIMLGSISKGKGQFELIDNISRLNEKIKNIIQIDIIGNGYSDDEKKLIEKIKEKKLEKIISVKKYDDNIRERICNYDIGINCSNAEGLGRVTIEYLSAGIAVLASNRGANLEIITNMENGIIYEKEKINDFNEKLEYLINNPNFLKKIVKNSVLGLEKFDLANNTKEIIKIYKEII